MRKQLVLHIGHPKTGTSSIQKLLVENSELIGRYGLCYPDFGMRYNAHHLLVEGLIHHAKDNFLPKSGITGDETVKHLKRVSEDESIETIVLSSEALVSATGVKPELDALADIFDLHVLWIVRAPAEYANSMVNQRIKMGFYQGGVVLERVIAETINEAAYETKGKIWRDHFPNSRFSVSAMGAGFDAWDFFCNEVEPRLHELERPKDRSNLSLAPEALAFLLRLQGQKRDRSTQECSRIISMLQDYTKTACIYPRNATVIPPEAQAALLRKFENTGAEMERMFPGFDPAGLQPQQREFVDLSTMPPEHIMRVYDFCMDRYNKHVDFLRR